VWGPSDGKVCPGGDLGITARIGDSGVDCRPSPTPWTDGKQALRAMVTGELIELRVVSEDPAERFNA
jgi:hypothetical protein